MKIFGVTLLSFLLLITGVAWIHTSAPTHPLKFEVPKGWPKPLYDFSKNPITQEGFELGRKLFYDNRLSKDQQISCGTCHQQFAAFSTFEHPLSHGVNNQQTTRNAPALQNLAWQENFMADGGITHLDLQPLAPITAENEMAETIIHTINKIKADTVYQRMFKAAFGKDAINTQGMGKAISQFMLMLVSNNSKYDRVMRGEDSFQLAEKLGYQIFQTKCINCHPAPFFTDRQFHNAGLPLDDYLKDYGRMKITGNSKDSLLFKTPSLRNVAITAPYGHDGRFNSLISLFEHYRSQMVLGPTTDTAFKNRLPLSNFEIGQLRAFLNTLTDLSFIKDPSFADPSNKKGQSTEHLH
jgi:cytochrome c peroxidase